MLLLLLYCCQERQEGIGTLGNVVQGLHDGEQPIRWRGPVAEGYMVLASFSAICALVFISLKPRSHEHAYGEIQTGTLSLLRAPWGTIFQATPQLNACRSRRPPKRVLPAG